MRIEDLQHARVIAIVGMPTTGKTTLANELRIELNIPDVFHTDDFIGSELTLQQTLLRNGVGTHEAFIVEGCMVYDLLVSGHVVPDVIINCCARAATRQLRYERRGKNFFAGKAFENRLVSKWFEYRAKFGSVRVIDHQTD